MGGYSLLNDENYQYLIENHYIPVFDTLILGYKGPRAM